MTLSVREVYRRIYANPESNYDIKGHREVVTRRFIENYEPKGSLLDVGCGKGTVLRWAMGCGFGPVLGLEVVDTACQGSNPRVQEIDTAADLRAVRSREWDLVICLDVLEHLEPEETEAALRELRRVAAKEVVVSVQNNSSVHMGVELHTNKRSMNEWERIIRGCWGKKAIRFNDNARGCWFRCNAAHLSRADTEEGQ